MIQTVQFRPVATAISLRPSDKRLGLLDAEKMSCQPRCDCRQCYCKTCGRLYRPDTASEELVRLFLKAA